MPEVMTNRTRQPLFRLLPALAGVLVAACAGPANLPGLSAGASITTPPEAASNIEAKPGWTFHRQAVAAANPLATDAGLVMLRAGGTAVGQLARRNADRLRRVF